MPFGIGKIKIKAPKIRAPKTPAELNFPKPRKLKSASRAIKKFDLTIFSSGSAGAKKTKITWRTGRDKNLAILQVLNKGYEDRSLYAFHYKDIESALYWINDCPESLKFYADKLGISVKKLKEKIKEFLYHDTITTRRMLAMKKSLNPTYIKILKALIETEGNQSAAAKKLNKHQANINGHVRDLHEIFQIDPRLAKPYAVELGVSVDNIITICDPNAVKKISTAKYHIKVLQTLIQTGGDQKEAAKILGKKSLCSVTQSISSSWDLESYAAELGVSVDYIKALCDNRISGQFRKADKTFSHNIKILRALFKAEGNQTAAAKILGQSQGSTNNYLHRQIFSLDDRAMKPYAIELGVSIEDIYNICFGSASQKLRAAKKYLMKVK